MANVGVPLIYKYPIVLPGLAKPQPYDGQQYGVNSRAVGRASEAVAEAAGYSNNAGQVAVQSLSALAHNPVVNPALGTVAVAGAQTLHVVLGDVSVSDVAATAVRVVGGSGGMQVGAAVLTGAAISYTCMHPALAGVVAVVNPVGAAIITGAVVTAAVGGLLWLLCKGRRGYAREMAYVTKVLNCSANETHDAFDNIVRNNWLRYHTDRHNATTNEAANRCHELQRCIERYVQLRGWDKTPAEGAEVIKTIGNCRLRVNGSECYRRLSDAASGQTFLAGAVLSKDNREVVTTDTYIEEDAVVRVRFSTAGALECVTAAGGRIDTGLLVRIAVVLPRCDGYAIYKAANPIRGAQPVGWIGISYLAALPLCVVTFGSGALDFLETNFGTFHQSSSTALAPAAATATSTA